MPSTSILRSYRVLQRRGGGRSRKQKMAIWLTVSLRFFGYFVRLFGYFVAERAVLLPPPGRARRFSNSDRRPVQRYGRRLSRGVEQCRHL